MTIGSSLGIDRTAQIQHPDDTGRAQVEILLYQLLQHPVIHLASTKGINHDGHRGSHADSISKLHFGTLCQAGSHDILCHITGSISAGAVNLRWILAGESAAAMTSHAAIGINNNLAPCQAAVTLRAADNELAGRVDEILGLLAKKLGRNNSIDDMLNQILANLVKGDVLIMLGGDNNGINSYRLAVLIGNSYLSLAIRAEIRQGAVLAHLGQAACQTMCQRDWQRQELRRLIGSIAEHHALVTGTGSLCLVQITFPCLQSLVNALGNIRRLLIQGNQNTAGISIKAELGTGIADPADGLPGNLGNIHIALGRNLTGNMSLAGSHQGLAGHTAIRILFKNCIQNTIRNLVCNFIRMPLSNRLRSKQ